MPEWVRAILAAIRPGGGPSEAIKQFDERTWREALGFCDRSGLTLVLHAALGERLPQWVRERMEGSLAGNRERHQRAKTAFAEIQDALAASGVEFLALKGFTQWPAFIPDPALRPQYDLDFYCRSEDVYRAGDAVAALGYDPLAEFGEFPTDHLPVMIRKTGWQWRGDFFDPEIPFSVELHFRFWDEETERITAPGLENFWPRRVWRDLGGRRAGVLNPADALGYTALHLLRHLLRGNLRPYHVYELAWFLERRHGDEEFWRTWSGLHEDGLRQLEAVAFRLAAAWFGCPLREEAAIAAEPAREWLERYAASPLEGLFRPNKDELWLHLGLVTSPAGRRDVLRRRLLPLRMPGPVDAIYIPRARLTWKVRLRSGLKYALFLGGRLWFHARVLPRFALQGLTLALGPAYWRFLATASLFNLGMFIFTLLYNLWLLDRGFGEGTIGLIAGMATAGSVAGTLPAAALAHRFGLRALLPACFASVGLISALRAWGTSEVALVASAGAGGACLAAWAVAVAPAISQLTSERRRALGFSVFFSFSIALGAAGGWLAGRLPGWVGGKQAALLAACGLMLAAALPAARLPVGTAPRASRVLPRGRFILRFLIALAVWNVAIGAFNPFFNTYFARRFQMPAEKIGLLFSVVQLIQVGPMLLAPWVLRRLGLATGIAATLAATGAALAGLAVGGGATAACVAYTMYMSFQYMSEPGLYTLLMGGVEPANRSGAAALNFLVAFGVQAVAAAAAGAGFSRFGYPLVLTAAGAAACLAAILFRVLLAPFAPAPRAGSAPE